MISAYDVRRHRIKSHIPSPSCRSSHAVKRRLSVAHSYSPRFVRLCVVGRPPLLFPFLSSPSPSPTAAPLRRPRVPSSLLSSPLLFSNGVENSEFQARAAGYERATTHSGTRGDERSATYLRAMRHPAFLGACGTLATHTSLIALLVALQAMPLWASPAAWSDSSRMSSLSSNSQPSGQKHDDPHAKHSSLAANPRGPARQAATQRRLSAGVTQRVESHHALRDRDCLNRGRLARVSAARRSRCALSLLLSCSLQCRFLDANSAARRLRGQVRNLGTDKRDTARGYNACS